MNERRGTEAEVAEIWVRAIAPDIVAVAMVWREEFKGDTLFWEARIFADGETKLDVGTFNKNALLPHKIAAATFPCLAEKCFWRPDA